MSVRKMIRFLILKFLRWRRRDFIPGYTKGEFDKQLSYNLWSTSRTRFAAAKRFQKKHELSGRTIAFSSAYLILLSLLQVFSTQDTLNQLITYSSISLAIVILVISQIEGFSNYSLRSHLHHQCGLQVNSLYKSLRRLKASGDLNGKDDEYWASVREIDDSYDSILNKYENHSDIDFKLFKANYPKYADHRCGWFYVLRVKVLYYFSTQLFYHCMTYLPPVFLVFLLLHVLNILPFCKLFEFPCNLH